MNRPLRLLALGLLPLIFSGCQVLAAITHSVGSAFEDDPPRVDTPAARTHRAVMSPATPDEDTFDPIAEYGPADDRDTNELDDLDWDEDLGHVVVRMEPGIYVLDDTTTIAGAESVLIEGAGTHKTRLELHSDDLKTLRFKGVGRVELRGLTIVGYLGGGVFFDGCPDVVIRDVHFAAIRYGVDLKASTAKIERSLFAGCANGIGLREGKAILSGTQFLENWSGIKGRGTVEATGTAFVENRTAVEARLGRTSSFESCLFAGKEQSAGWKGTARATGNLAHRRDVGQGKRFDQDTNETIFEAEQFPQSVQLPRGFDVPTVHMALERASTRGNLDPNDDLDQLAFEGAQRYALAARTALKKEDLASAREAVALALRYWGDRPLAEGPPILIDVAAIAQPK